MLAREKRRSVWSLAIGIALGIGVLSYWYVQSQIADVRLARLVAHCKSRAARATTRLPPGFSEKPIQPSPTPVARNPSDFTPDPEAGRGHLVPDPPPAGFEDLDLVCEPEDLVDYVYANGEQAQISDTAREANNDRANGRLFGLLTFVAFCLPLGWYFLLDRLREVSDALSGRDRAAR
jgi:hypothetical protein